MCDELGGEKINLNDNRSFKFKSKNHRFLKKNINIYFGAFPNLPRFGTLVWQF